MILEYTKEEVRRLVQDRVCMKDLEPSCRLDLVCDVNYQKDEIGIELQLHSMPRSPSWALRYALSHRESRHQII